MKKLREVAGMCLYMAPLFFYMFYMIFKMFFG